MHDGPDTPTQARGTTAALALLAMLTERYPATFRHEGEPPRPLAIGIGDRPDHRAGPRRAVVHTPCGSTPGAARISRPWPSPAPCAWTDGPPDRTREPRAPGRGAPHARKAGQAPGSRYPRPL